MDEVEARDWHWLYTGEPPTQEYSRSPRNSYGVFLREPDLGRRPNPSDYDVENFKVAKKSGEWRDLFAHDVLRWNGISIETRPVRFPGPNGKPIQGATSPDLAFARNGWGKGYLWEIKSPMANPDNPPKPGNELNFIGSAFQEASLRNFKNPYDPTTNQPVRDWDGKRRVVLNIRYRPVEVTKEELLLRILNEMRDWHIEEVLLIDADGNLTHLKGKGVSRLP